jgi:hypothetical protein
MLRELSSAHTRRAAVLRDIAALVPPKCDQARLSALDTQLQSATSRMRELADHHCDGLARAAASYHDVRSERLHMFQRSLVDEHVCAVDEVAAVLAADCVPRLQKITAEHTDAIETLRGWVHQKVRGPAGSVLLSVRLLDWPSIRSSM